MTCLFCPADSCAINSDHKPKRIFCKSKQKSVSGSRAGIVYNDINFNRVNADTAVFSYFDL